MLFGFVSERARSDALHEIVSMVLSEIRFTARKFGRTIMNGLRRNRIVELKNSSFLHNEIPIVPSSKRMLQKIDNEKKSWLLWWANYFIKSGGFDQWLIP